MLKNILFTTFLLAMVGMLKAQTAVDTALAGEWVLEKMVVCVQKRDIKAQLETYELTDVMKMYRISKYVIQSIRFSEGRFFMDNGGGHSWGRVAETGVREMALLADSIPGSAGRTMKEDRVIRYGWEKTGDQLHLTLPETIYRDHSLNALVEARYVCQFIRRK